MHPGFIEIQPVFTFLTVQNYTAGPFNPNDRPQLAAALAACRARRAALVIAKLDRLARNARFLLHVVEGTGEAGVVFCDLPSVPPGPVGKFLLTQMATVAELEAGLISQRTRAALAAAKARGTVLGNPRLRAGAPEQAWAAAAAKSAQARARAADVLPLPRCRPKGRRAHLARVGRGTDQSWRADACWQGHLATRAGQAGAGFTS